MGKSDRRFGWALSWLGFGVGAVTVILTASPSGPVLAVMSAFAGLSFSLSPYYFGFFEANKFVRAVILIVIWGVAALAVYERWPATFTVYQGQVFFAGKHRVALVWLVNPAGVCPSHVTIYLFIRNDQPLAARIST